jgi:hypothetical protein
VEAVQVGDAADAYRIIWHYTAGEISSRAAAARRREDARPTYRSRVFAELDSAELPRLAALGERWEELTGRDTYDKGVRAIAHCSSVWRTSRFTSSWPV